MFQLQLAKADWGKESAPPDDWTNFAENEFVPIDDPYDRVAFDSDKYLCLTK